MRRPAPRTRVWFARAALVALATVCAAAGGEAFARRRYPLLEMPLAGANVEPALVNCAYAHPTRGWAVLPNRCLRDARGLLPGHDGMRPDGWKLLVVGDSVGERDWVPLLAAGLEAKAGQPITVFNASLSGYDTCQGAVTLRERIAELAPDGVLVQTCVNDVFGSATVAPSGPHWTRVSSSSGWRRVPTLLLRSRIAQLVVLSRSRPPDMRQRLARVTACARDMAEAAEEAGIPLAVVHFPALVDAEEETYLARGLAADGRALRQAWQGVAAPQIDGGEALRAVDKLSAFADRPEDRIHPKNAASDVIATAFVPEVGPALGLW
jgi:hypothetical protein